MKVRNLPVLLRKGLYVNDKYTQEILVRSLAQSNWAILLQAGTAVPCTFSGKRTKKPNAGLNLCVIETYSALLLLQRAAVFGTICDTINRLLSCSARSAVCQTLRLSGGKVKRCIFFLST